LSDKPDLSLDVDDLDPEPMVQFRRWYEDADAEGIHLVNAIALATADATGSPAVRHVLLRGFDERGFVFYTNYESRKARHLAENPRAAFAMLWKELDRQVCVTGVVERTTPEESAAYFATRPREARLGAWASRQSEVLESRAELTGRFTDTDRRFPGEDVPLPSFWGGFRLIPDSVEFWQGRAFRLHDRLRYTRAPDGWLLERLSP
jgi:pyridoxamine 5'-phosphate oxidase